MLRILGVLLGISGDIWNEGRNVLARNYARIMMGILGALVLLFVSWGVKMMWGFGGPAMICGLLISIVGLAFVAIPRNPIVVAFASFVFGLVTPGVSVKTAVSEVMVALIHGVGHVMVWVAFCFGALALLPWQNGPWMAYWMCALCILFIGFIAMAGMSRVSIKVVYGYMSLAAVVAIVFNLTTLIPSASQTIEVYFTRWGIPVLGWTPSQADKAKANTLELNYNAADQNAAVSILKEYSDKAARGEMTEADVDAMNAKVAAVAAKARYGVERNPIATWWETTKGDVEERGIKSWGYENLGTLILVGIGTLLSFLLLKRIRRGRSVKSGSAGGVTVASSAKPAPTGSYMPMVSIFIVVCALAVLVFAFWGWFSSIPKVDYILHGYTPKQVDFQITSGRYWTGTYTPVSNRVYADHSGALKMGIPLTEGSHLTNPTPDGQTGKFNIVMVTIPNRPEFNIRMSGECTVEKFLQCTGTFSTFHPGFTTRGIYGGTVTIVWSGDGPEFQLFAKGYPDEIANGRFISKL